MYLSLIERRLVLAGAGVAEGAGCDAQLLPPRSPTLEAPHSPRRTKGPAECSEGSDSVDELCRCSRTGERGILRAYGLHPRASERSVGL